MARTLKLTISLPRNLFLFVSDLAKERNVSRSKVFSDILQEFAEQCKRDQMIEGYKAMASENRRFAEDILPIASEIWPDWEY